MSRRLCRSCSVVSCRPWRLYVVARAQCFQGPLRRSLLHAVPRPFCSQTSHNSGYRWREWVHFIFIFVFIKLLTTLSRYLTLRYYFAQIRRQLISNVYLINAIFRDTVIIDENYQMYGTMGAPRPLPRPQFETRYMVYNITLYIHICSLYIIIKNNSLFFYRY